MKSLKESLSELIYESMSPSKAYDAAEKLVAVYKNPYFWSAVCGNETWNLELDEIYDWESGDSYELNDKAIAVFGELFPTEKDFDDFVKACTKMMVWDDCDPNEIGYVIDNWGDEYDENDGENEWYGWSKAFSNPFICMSHSGGKCLVTGYTKGCNKKFVDTILKNIKGNIYDLSCDYLGAF